MKLPVFAKLFFVAIMCLFAVDVVLAQSAPAIAAATIDAATLQIWGTKAAAIVGCASLAVRAFDTVASITPNTKDDEYAHSMVRGLGYVVMILDRLALNPPADSARK